MLKKKRLRPRKGVLMKVTIMNKGKDMTVYIPKKDMEVKVVVLDPDHVFGGTLELTGGMKIYVEPMAEMPRLPLTVEAKRL